jgi:hypothetical protein
MYLYFFLLYSLFLLKFNLINSSENLDFTSKLNSKNNKALLIIKRDPNHGFWSNFFCILAGVDQADKKSLIPYIDMESYQMLYKEDIPILGTKNAWEYFFFQPTRKIPKKPIKTFFLNSQDPISRATMLVPEQSTISRCKYLIKNYIHIKPDIELELNRKIPKKFDKSILGIHVRGTDRKKGCYGHLLTDDPEKYLQKALDLDSKFKFNKIFLACDELETLSLFINTFENRLIYNDAFRVSKDSNCAAHTSNEEHTRHLHKYLLGKEVLIDALLLSRCGHFIFGPSNVAHAAIIFSENSQNLYPVDSPGMFFGN